MFTVKLITLAAALVCTTAALGQSPVSWTFSSKRISPTTWEINMTAHIQSGYHIYSQHQEADNVPGAITTISYTKNPVVMFKGGTEEIGELVHSFVSALGIVQNEYRDTVEFKQLLTVRSPVKLTVSGTIRFMACTNSECLPPEDERFEIALNPAATAAR